jgi:transposase InsO family protein
MSKSKMDRRKAMKTLAVSGIAAGVGAVSIGEARAGIGRYFEFFNDERPHSALGYQTPASFYDGLLGKAASRFR